MQDIPSPIAPQSIFPALAASNPALASSTTRQPFGSSERNLAAFRNTSGSGLELIILFPSEIASKYPKRPIRSKMNPAFLLEDPMPSFSPFKRRALSVAFTSPERSFGSYASITPYRFHFLFCQKRLFFLV